MVGGTFSWGIFFLNWGAKGCVPKLPRLKRKRGYRGAHNMGGGKGRFGLKKGKTLRGIFPGKGFKHCSLGENTEDV